MVASIEGPWGGLVFLERFFVGATCFRATAGLRAAGLRAAGLRAAGLRGACLISQFAKIQVHRYSHFVTIFVVTGGPLMPLQQDCANVLCAFMLSSLPEAPSESWIQDLACKNTVQPAVDLWDVREQGQTLICKVL